MIGRTFYINVYEHKFTGARMLGCRTTQRSTSNRWGGYRKNDDKSSNWRWVYRLRVKRRKVTKT